MARNGQSDCQMCSCFAIIAPDEIGALEVLGKFRRIMQPGFHILPPLSLVRKKSTRIIENKVVVETKSKDNVFVKVHISVQQELFQDKAKEAIYKLANPQSQIDSYVADVVRGHVPSMELDMLFENKDEIALEVKQRLTVGMKDYGYHILQVLVVDIEPDPKVKAAMNEINANRRLRMAAEEKAEADKIVLVKKAEAEKILAVLSAEAEAESKFLQGQGIARSRGAIVDGLRATLAPDGKNLSTKEVQELLLVTQYFDTLEKMSQGSATTIFMSHSPGNLGDISETVRRGLLEASASAPGAALRR